MRRVSVTTLRSKIIKIGLPCRVIVLFLPFLFEVLGGFRHDEFRELMYLLFPLGAYTLLYIGRYVFKNAYRVVDIGKTVSILYFRVGYFGFMALNIGEFLLIVYKALYGSPDIEDFLLYLGAIEVVFVIYTIWFITGLFGNFGNPPGTDAAN